MAIDSGRTGRGRAGGVYALLAVADAVKAGFQQLTLASLGVSGKEKALALDDRTIAIFVLHYVTPADSH